MRREEKAIIQTLRIEPRALAAILDELQETEAKSELDKGREHERVWLSKRVLVAFKGKDSATTQYEAMVRNISAQGMAFVIGLYIYQDTPCVITIHTYTGEQQCITGMVKRCRHIAGMVHEVGVEFESQVEMEEFVRPTTLHTGGSTKSADLSNAEGSVLLIDDNELDARLLEHALSDSQLSFMHAGDGAGSLEFLNQNPALIFVDQNLPDTNGVTLIKQIKESGYTGRFIMVTGEESEQIRMAAMQAGAMGVLIKPWSAAELRTLVAQAFTTANNSPLHGTAPIVSTADPSEIPPDLVKSFVDDLASICETIDSAVDPLQRDTIRSSAMRVKGAALSCGFAPLTHAANRLVHAIDEKEDDATIKEGTQTLAAVCRRATLPSDWEQAA